MSKVNAAARAYAQALFELASEKQVVEKVEGDLSAFVEIVDSSRELARLIRSPQVAGADKGAIVSEIGKKAGFDGLTQRFLSLMADRSRLPLVVAAYREFRALSDEARNVLRGMVTTADVVPPEQVRDLERTFTKKFNKTVMLEASEDREILGGLVVRIGDLTFDGSLKTALKNIKHNLERQYV